MEYHQSWKTWWTGIQPGWRKAPDGTLMCPTDVSETREWPQTSIGGPNGFLIIVLTLAWWIRGLQDDWKDAALSWAVDDVFWALSEMTSSLRVRQEGGKGVKRVTNPGSEELGDHAVPAKRWVHCFC